MTVSYQYDVASSSSGGFTRLLFKWKGSVYKLVWRELAWFSFAYTLLSVLYRYILTDGQKRDFERVVYKFDEFLAHIPLSFVLGVYVTLVVQRWWSQYEAIPWPDKFCHCIALYVTGYDDTSRLFRRTIARYLNLSLVLVLRSISMAVKKRFPTLQHLVEGGFMTKAELDIYLSVPSSEFNTYWIPCTWVIHLIKEARKGKIIVDSQGLKLLVEEFNEFRSKCGMLWSYDWVSIPLVYTQVVTLATYSFFAACVIGRQYVEPIDEKDKLRNVDLFIPILTFLQFFFYMGLLKVAEALINPFGDDDEDFELNWLIDRHLKVSYLLVDTLINRIPPLAKDVHYDETEPTLTYTKAAMMYKKKTFRGSVAAVLVPEEDQTLVLPEIIEEDEESLEHSNNLSATKTSSSIINLLTWTANTGSKMMSHGHHHKRPSTEGHFPKSPSLTDTFSALESGYLQPPSLHHDPAFSRFSTSAGIRGRFLSSPASSSEVMLQNKNLGYDYYGPASSKEDRSKGKLFRGDSAETASTSSSHQDIDANNSSGENSNKSRKSKSLDMGKGIVKDTETAKGKRNRSRSCAAKLRDFKRKYQRKRQTSETSSTSPSSGKHRLWKSKESLPKTQRTPAEGPSASAEDNESIVSDPPLGAPLSLSLPSIHIAIPDEECEAENTGNSCEDDEIELPKLISMFASKNGAGKKAGKFNIGKYSPSLPRKSSIKSVLPQVHVSTHDSDEKPPTMGSSQK